MSAGSHSPGALDTATLQSERTRIVAELYERSEDMADAGVSAILARIPAYAARGDRFRADVHDQVTQLTRLGLGALLEDRRVTPADVGATRVAATRRAQSGVTLVEYLKAFRLSQQALWKALISHAGDSEVGREAALSMVTPLSRFCDLISTQAANAFLEHQQYLATENRRETIEVIDGLLDGVLPGGGPALSLAHAHGIGLSPGAPMVVVTAVLLGGGDRPEAAAEARRRVCAALARTGVTGTRTLAGVRGGEVVAIVVLGRDGSTVDLVGRLRAVTDHLRAEGLSVAMAVSTVATSVARLPHAHQRAVAALDLLPDSGGVLALPALSPFRYLLLRADDTARHLVDHRIRDLLADDRARGGTLADTIRAFAAADMNLREAAVALRVHLNTAKYRLGRIQDLTGRNLRRVDDLIELLVAIDLQDPHS
ncbi:PucR family transcriptional regulator [Nocardia thailandica]|uniref:PucR family transcriptional regulator n=2 Tax=Nocardia thailandica TaxID=257275 RepID=A0ABW6PLX1_9NOCA